MLDMYLACLFFLLFFYEETICLFIERDKGQIVSLFMYLKNGKWIYSADHEDTAIYAFFYGTVININRKEYEI